MTEVKKLTIDGRPIPIEGERNILEVARKAGIDIPTFCYHSELSVYGACRLCLVDIEGMGIMASCSVAPREGMVVKSNTEEIRKMRKIAIELLLANHNVSCPTCIKSTTCKLLALARRFGVDELRYQSMYEPKPIDASSPSIVRDQGKCILCGDCVRMCDEIQGIGAIDFAFRGSHSAVLPAFNQDLAKVECVNCGQCAAVCPTGALAPKSEVEDVWKALHDPTKTVVVQMAPAVRSAIGEYFGAEPSTATTNRAVTAMRVLGFDRVYDTSFAADLTIFEEATEFIDRLQNGGKLPIFTSCCPAWVKFAEQYYPELLGNLSSAKSPQQMFSALGRKVLPAELNVDKKDLVIVSLMPCTAKKFEAKLDKFKVDGQPDTDHVITTQELGAMIQEAGINFNALEPEAFDAPFGFKTGAGVIFGNSGGVMEAVLRYVARDLNPDKKHSNEKVEYHDVRGEKGVRETELKIGDLAVKVAVVFGLANAKRIAKRVADGDAPWQAIEIMACPGGCIAGGGQPISQDPNFRKKRTKALYENDQIEQVRVSQDNVAVQRTYAEVLGHPGSHAAHEMLHTHYQNRKRLDQADFHLIDAASDDAIQISVCVGTNCFINGSQQILGEMTQYIDDNDLGLYVDLQAVFCMEKCGQAPNVKVGEVLIGNATFAKVKAELEKQLQNVVIS